MVGQKSLLVTGFDAGIGLQHIYSSRLHTLLFFCNLEESALAAQPETRKCYS